MLPEKIRLLNVSIDQAEQAGQLIRASTYEFRYMQPDPEQAVVALLMPPQAQLTWQDGDLFPPMDQNLPEGDLFMKIRALFPKQPMTPMHLLALVGRNGIGRLGFSLPEWPAPVMPRSIGKSELLKTAYTPEVFNELVAAYLSTGAGIAGMQPKIMVPDRPTVPMPSLIVKAASPAYPGLAANEFLCLTAARHAGIDVPAFALSDDGQMLVLDRFDQVIHDDGSVELWTALPLACPSLAGPHVRRGDHHHLQVHPLSRRPRAGRPNAGAQIVCWQAPEQNLPHIRRTVGLWPPNLRRGPPGRCAATDCRGHAQDPDRGQG